VKSVWLQEEGIQTGKNKPSFVLASLGKLMSTVLNDVPAKRGASEAARPVVGGGRTAAAAVVLEAAA
jgi:hypothetical protein